MKKLTVIGTIGNTHGVIRAAKPLRKEIIKIKKIDFEFDLSLLFELSSNTEDSCSTIISLSAFSSLFTILSKIVSFLS
ncbi:MAG: Uncharacterised protein [Crocinitomicaceae bacterium]|nr:MAG: Uncharacterised protein [Crocinitomicaceae bacterium]